MLNSKENREIWMSRANAQNDVWKKRTEADIEKHRKGYSKLRFVDESGNPKAGIKVKITQTSHDFKYGANIFMLDEFPGEQDNKTYRENFKKYFNLATVPFYWAGLEPEEGKPRYDKNSPKVYRRPSPDLCVEYCEENGIDAKLHCLVYEGFLPDWLPKNDMGKMEEFYEERIRQIAERYSGRLMEFEVINELLQEAGWKNQSVISDKHDIVEWGFGLARKYLPFETLVINEGNPLRNLGVHDFRSPYYMLIENALRGGAEIDKIGLQHHIFTGASTLTDEEYENAVKKANLDMVDPEIMLKGLDVAETLGLPIEFTEVTVPTFGDTLEDEELQADMLELLYTVWFSHRAVDSVVYWNVPDGYAHVASDKSRWDENKCRGGLWHHDLTPKKSAERLYYLFNEKWHTDLELKTDQNGYVEFRGFYGEYIAETEDAAADFGIHKSSDNTLEIIL